MKKLSQMGTGNTINLPERAQCAQLMNIFTNDGIQKRIAKQLGQNNKWATLENDTAIQAISSYINDINLNIEDRIYRHIEKYIDAKLTNTLNSIQNWIIEEYSHNLEHWLKEEFALDLIENIKERMQSENFNIDEDVKQVLEDCVNKYR